ncbi:O-methyltransferase family 2 [Penicillium coprophilum]|uniref:O-methyltransferase family 2 n=1 Tax=Penicillium coprophilum TaxID=36646 RepID=UPI00238AA4E0|nr:O-methyltransferase family 2 [Penicillium coprophilum]KAJ5171344.1 O-methyltransferase family 2 [Penicillium coprophilum]
MALEHNINMNYFEWLGHSRDLPKDFQQWIRLPLTGLIDSIFSNQKFMALSASLKISFSLMSEAAKVTIRGNSERERDAWLFDPTRSTTGCFDYREISGRHRANYVHTTSSVLSQSMVYIIFILYIVL